MTKSTITKTDIQMILNDDWLLMDDCEGLKNGDVVKMLARMALAAMDSEPVAWLAIYHGEVYDEAISITRSVVEAQADRFGWESALTEIIPLYRHAQPAPVVSADLLHTAASAIEDLLTTKDRTGAGVWFDLPFQLRSAANAQPASVVLKDHQTRELVNQLRDIAIEYHGTQQLRERIARVLRAAMLQDEPVTTANKLGSSPVIPDTWIPVSERMPEDDVSVLTFDGMYKRVHHAMYGHWQCWEPEKITHWMPLPATPQEVKP